MKNVKELAKVIRSKNSGPYELTFDIIFNNKSDFVTIRDKNLINPERISGLFNISPDEIRSIIFFDPALAVKILMARRIPSGAPGDTDVYGAQQHAPLLDLDFEI